MKELLFKRYRVIEKLGVGGNGEVFKVYDQKRKIECALKILKGNPRSQYYSKKVQRFSDEIKIVIENQAKISGILPIFDYNISQQYWYTMELATPIEEYLAKFRNELRVQEVVKIIESLATSLIKLHNKGIVHRDIKPNNIYYFKGTFCLGDFGLVDFPDKLNITQMKESVGPKDTIAPEMKRNAYIADGKKADVYSLSKTLWILLTKNMLSFDGQYIANDKTIGVSNYLKNEHLIELEELLTLTTDNTPDNRPTMKEFYTLLNEWWEIRRDIDKAHKSQWQNVQKQLFGIANPSRMQWNNVHQIVKTLQTISTYNQLNHMFMPDGGGLDMESIGLAGEEGCIVISGNGVCNILKPYALYYENILDDPMWSYFRIDFDQIEPIENEPRFVSYEEVTEMLPGEYASWIYGNYGYDEKGTPLPNGYRIVARYIKGAIVIFAKASIYNRISGTYDGRHSKMSSDEFRSYIENMRELHIRAVGDNIEGKFINYYNQNPFKKYDREQERLQYQRRAKEEATVKQFIRDKIQTLNLKNVIREAEQEYLQVAPVVYYLGLTLEDTYTFGESTVTYDIDENCNIIKTNADSWSFEKCCIQNPYKFINFEQIIYVKEKLMEILKKECIKEKIDWIDTLQFKVNFERTGKPTHLFSKDEIKKVLENGNDHIHNTLVVDMEGNVKLVPDGADLNEYAVRHEGYCAYNNYVGKYSGLSHLEQEYIGTLEAWLDHLKYGVQVYKDYNDYDHTEQELVEEIKKYM